MGVRSIETGSNMSEITLSHGPIERFLILAKGANGRAVAMTIDQALSAPDVHVFAELLDVPSVQKLKGTPQESAVNLLELFAYGTYRDYKEAAASLPALKPDQAKKLRMLTIVTMGVSQKILQYSDLMTALDVGTLRELEDLIIEGQYRKLLSGKMDQKNQRFMVDNVIGRDLKPGDLERMNELFSSWAQNCQTIINEMDTQMNVADGAKAHDAQIEKEILAKIEQIKAEEKKKADGDNPRRGHGPEYGNNFLSSDYHDEVSRNDTLRNLRGKRP